MTPVLPFVSIISLPLLIFLRAIHTTYHVIISAAYENATPAKFMKKPLTRIFEVVVHHDIVIISRILIIYFNYI